MRYGEENKLVTEASLNLYVERCQTGGTIFYCTPNVLNQALNDLMSIITTMTQNDVEPSRSIAST
jgi:hypothetical protein